MLNTKKNVIINLIIQKFYHLISILDGLLEDGDDFADFRNRVVELIKDVVFIVGSANVFKHMFAYLHTVHTTNTWESSEAALFIMSAVARNLFPNENENVPPVLESILNNR